MNQADNFQQVSRDNHGIAACDEFCLKYRPVVLRYVSKFDNHELSPEDVTQDVLLLAWQSLGNFRGDSSIKTYILSIARRRVFKRLKRLSSRKSPVGLDQVTEEASDSFNDLTHPESEAYRREIVYEVHWAISQLTPKQAEAVELFCLKEISQEEAAEYVNCSVQAFKDRFRRACNRLRKLLWHLKD